VKILVIKPSSLGDVIHGLQVAAAIKDGLPGASIDWVVRDCFSEMVKFSALASRILLFHRGSGLRKFHKLIAEIRERHYDYVLDMQGLARSGVMTYFSDADVKIGRSDAREFSWLAYDRRISLPRAPHVHAIDILLQFLPEFGLPPELRGCVKFSAKPTGALETFCENISADGTPVILLFPESRRREKIWPYFHELSVALSRKFTDARLVMVAQNEILTGERPKNFYNLSGKTSIGDMIWLLQNCSVAVANDSAPMHLAAAMKIPVVALFGPTDPQKFGPYPIGDWRNFVIQAPGGDLASLTVDTVASAVCSGFIDGMG
jgi:ADP-heptose:LPS heptosyltransferase